MKTKFKYGISAYSGTIDDMTFASYKNGRVCVARKYYKPRSTEQNAIMAAEMKNIRKLYSLVSEEYLEDLRTYAYYYSLKERQTPKLQANSFAIFVKLLYAFRKTDPVNIDLSSIVMDDLEDLYPEITSIATAVEAGYLPNVVGADLLVNKM